MARNELWAQRIIVDALRASGGFAFKMSHKFLVGVPDLFVKLPEAPASFWEVKIKDRPANPVDFSLPLTPPQKNWLRDYNGAGGVCGVVSVLRGPAELYLAVVRYEVISYGDSDVRPWRIHRRAHTVIDRGNRNKAIFDIFNRGLYETHQP